MREAKFLRHVGVGEKSRDDREQHGGAASLRKTEEEGKVSKTRLAYATQKFAMRRQLRRNLSRKHSQP